MRRLAQPLVARRTLAVVLFFVLAGLAPAGHPSTADQGVETMRIVATVRAVDTRTGVIEVLTGVGHAVRVLRLQVADDVKMTVPWAAVHLSSFIPGTHARIEYIAAPTTTTRGTVVSIEAMDVERTRGTK